MNRVFCCADDSNIKIYHQDTDSIHMNYDDVDKRCKYYKQTYNQELVGDGLGNVHIEFDLPGAVSDIYSKESYFLGKKTYIDILEPTDEFGNVINAERIRMRGIPTSCIKYEADKNNITVLDIYKRLFNGEAIEFDLTNQVTKFVCKNNKDHTISNVTKFTRTTKFYRGSEDKIFIN